MSGHARPKKAGLALDDGADEASYRRGIARSSPSLDVVVDTTPSMSEGFERGLAALVCDRLLLIPFLQADDA